MRRENTSNLRVEVLPPSNPFLMRFIKHFYFIRGRRDPELSYVTFPQLTTSIYLIKNMRLQFNKSSRRICSTHDPSAAPQAKVFRPFSRPTVVTLIGEVNEVAIVFRPLGINHFIKRPYVIEVGGAEHLFLGFGDALDKFLSELFALETNEGRREAVEYFLLRQYVGFENQRLKQALPILVDVGNQSSITAISSHLGISSKTFDRLALTHLGTTPCHIRKVARFRHSAELITTTGGAMRLTDIAQASQYYDQADFIRQYHQLAGATPKHFFKHTSNIGGAGILWRML